MFWPIAVNGRIVRHDHEIRTQSRNDLIIPIDHPSTEGLSLFLGLYRCAEAHDGLGEYIDVLLDRLHRYATCE